MLRMLERMATKESLTRIIWEQNQRWGEVRRVKPKSTKRVKTTKKSPPPLPAPPPPPPKTSETNQTQKSENNHTTSSDKKIKCHSLNLMNYQA